MPTLGDVLKKAVDFLKQKGVSEPRLSAQWLLAHVLGMKRLDLFLNFDRPLSDQELSTYRELIARRLKHEPLSYILGFQPFFGLDLKVNPSVLIPRKETEELVEHILKFYPQDRSLKGLDLCTGSGAIACALKKHRPNWTLHACDISQEALDVAECNAKAHQLEIVFSQGDLSCSIKQKFDFVVCNPPYIAASFLDALEAQVKNYEPKIALDGGVCGLDFYERLQKQLPSILNPGAHLFFEIGYDQGQVVVALFGQAPYDGAYSLKDLSGNDRFVFVCYKGDLCLGS